MASGAIAKTLRWLLVPLAVVAIVAVSVGGARWGITLADARCPAASMVGGTCVEPWHATVMEAAIYAALVVAVLGIVVVPAMIAPHLKRTLATLLFVVAVAVVGRVYLLTNWPELLRPLTVTIVTGAVGLWWVWFRRSRA